MKKFIAGGLLITLLLIFAATYPLLTKLCISNAEGRALLVLDIDKSDRFDISFRHSVNKGIVKEEFHICEDGSFALETAWFESYGAGMLDTIPEGAAISEEGDFMRIDFAPNPLREVAYGAAGIAGHELVVHSTGQKVRLFDLNPYKTCRISVIKVSLLQNFLNQITER